MRYTYTHKTENGFNDHVAGLAEAGYTVDKIISGVAILTATDHSTGTVYTVVIVLE